MNKTILRLCFALLLALCVCLSFAACGDGSGNTDSSSSGKGSSSSTPPSVDSSVPSSTPSNSSSSDNSSSDNSSTGSSDSGNSSTDTSSGNKDDGGQDIPKPPVVPETTEHIKINYSYSSSSKIMVHVGATLKGFSELFDEQYTLNDPRSDILNGIFPKFPNTVVPVHDADGNGDITDADREHVYEITLDLGAEHYIESFYAFFSEAGHTITFETGTPFSYETIINSTSEAVGWRRIDMKVFTRYINIKFKNGQAPLELMLYGARTGEYDEVNTEKHNYKTFDYLLGMCGNQSDSATTLSCTNYFRDYINWLWCFDRSVYPKVPGTTYSTTMSSRYDSKYQVFKTYKIDPVPCYMFRPDDFEVESVNDYMKPETYVMYGEFMFQSALRFGYNKDNTPDMIKILNSLQVRYNKNAIKWIEAGNEPNGEGNDGFSPYELAAFTSTAYDGHCGTVIAPTGSGVGVINANANVRMAMAGLAGVGVNYIQAMSFWMEFNRPDGELGLDAFNVHTYCKKLIRYNGYQVYVGVCPEIGNMTYYIEQLCEWRNMYYPDKEVWLTEFGWDTNTSYATENACHPYADFTAREIQAMWLVRAYFMVAKAGVDRAAMYQAPDGGPEETTVGKYGTSGVIASNGEYKDSYYYLYTLKNTMGDMYFAEVIDSGDENVWIYRFENGKGKSCYALWCPTMDDIRVDGYTLNIDGNNATLTEFANKETSGVSSELTVTNGTVTVNVGERPILVFSE